jgi:hypothetical protein
LTDGLWRFFPLQRTLLWLVMASLLSLARADAIRAAAPQARLGVLAGWLVAAWASILMQRSMTIVYLGPLIAPTLLLGGLGVTAGLPLKERYPEPLRLLALGLASAVMAFQIPGAHLDRASPADALAAAAKIVRDAGPAPSDKLLVVNRGILLNSATDLDPPTKIIFTAHALCDFAPESRGWMAAELDARPRFVVIADRARGAVCELPERWAMVDAALSADYREIGRAPGATESFAVYERR